MIINSKAKILVSGGNGSTCVAIGLRDGAGQRGDSRQNR